MPTSGFIMPKKWNLGDRAFEVEWVVKEGFDTETGESDPDRHQWRRRIFPDHKSAFAEAKRIFPKAVLGYVEITEVELTDPYGDQMPWTYTWDYVGETEMYEGEES